MAGLKRNLQSKVAGVERDFKQLLLRGRFEEGKIRDLSSKSDRCSGSENSSHSGTKRSTPAGQQGKPTTGSQPNPREGADHCFTCRGVGHYVKIYIHIREEVLQLKHQGSHHNKEGTFQQTGYSY